MNKKNIIIMSEGFSNFLSTVFENKLSRDIVLRIGNDCVSTTCVKNHDKSKRCDWFEAPKAPSAGQFCNKEAQWIMGLAGLPLCGFHAVLKQRKRKLDEEADENDLLSEFERLVDISTKELEQFTGKRRRTQFEIQQQNREIVQEFE